MAIVEAKAEGSVTITATNTAGISANKTWTVQYYPLTSLTINGDTTMNVGETQQLTYTYERYKSEIPTNVVWESDDSNVIAVSSSGVATAVGAGTATITLTAEGTSVSATTTIIVASTGPTGWDDTAADNVPRKVLIGGQIYLLRGEKIYTLQGARVK